MAAALPSRGTVSIHEPSLGEFGVWVTSLISTDPRDTRAGRLRDSPTTTLLPGLRPTTGAKRHSARRQQLNAPTRYSNTAKDNLEFPSQPFAGLGALTFPRDRMSLPAARAVECTELGASPSSRESLRRLPWCTCVSASARQSRAQCCAREFCGKKERKKTEIQTRDGGGGQDPHLHEQDFGRTISTGSMPP